MPMPADRNQAQSFWQFMLLMVITCGLYQVLWFYRAWGFLSTLGYSSESRWNNPTTRAIASIIPVLNLVMTWKLFHCLSQVAEDNQLARRYSPKHLFLLYNGLCLTDAFIAALYLGQTVNSATDLIINTARIFILAVAPTYFLFLPQLTINDCAGHGQGTTRTASPISWPEGLLVLCSLGIWTAFGAWAYSSFYASASRLSPNTVNAIADTRKPTTPIDEGESTETPAPPETDRNEHLQAATLNNEAVSALDHGDFAVAIEKLQQALKLVPEYAPARKNLSIAYNNYALSLPPEQAVIYFDKSLQFDPANAKTMSNLKVLQRNMQKKRKHFPALVH